MTDRRALWVGLGVPGACTAVLAGAAALGRLSLSAPSLAGPALALGTALPLTAAVLYLGRASWSPAHRFLLSLASGVSVFAAALALILTWPGPPPAAVSALAGAGGAVLAWRGLPAGRRVGSVRLRPEGAGGGAPPEWAASLRPEGPVAVFVAVSLAPLGIFTAWLWATGSKGRWFLLATAVGTGLLMAAFLFFRVRVTPAGLGVRSVLGWPRFNIPLHDIRAVRVERIDPLADFGGWGLRWGRGRTGIVMGEGEGIVIERAGGRVFAVTTPEAAVPVEILSRAMGEPPHLTR